jgi:fumarate hydratase subunit beta
MSAKTPLGTALEVAAPLDRAVAARLRAGQEVLLTGQIYTARDAAHKRLAAAVDGGQPLPLPLADQVIYYVGPCPARPGQPIGSAGPTSSYRMDPYTPALLAAGLGGMIGKGPRSAAVREAVVKHGAVYFIALGGAGALLARAVRRAEVVSYPELGAEAIHRLEVVRFPVIVGLDAVGGDAYEQARRGC